MKTFQKTFRGKKVLLATLLLPFLFAVNLHATTFTVSVQNFSFTPSNVNCNVGDTIKWVWVNGTHTTTSTSVPGGAATWGHNIDTSNTSFIYVVTKPGTYNYQCNFHAGMGMIATLNAQPAGISTVNKPALLSYFPNPVHTQLTINLNTSLYAGTMNVIITNIEGQEICRKQLQLAKGNNTYSLDLSSLANGAYVINLSRQDERLEAFAIMKD